MKCADPECANEVDQLPAGVSGRKRHFCAKHRTRNAKANRSYHRRKAGLPPLCPYRR